MQGGVVSGVLLPLMLAFIVFSLDLDLTAVGVPVGTMMGQVFLVLGLPVGIGMLVRHLQPIRALRLEPIATKVATWLLVPIVLLVVVKNWLPLRDNFQTLAPFAVTLNITMLACGFLIAWMVRLSGKQSVTLGIETAMQNAALALVIASSVLKDNAMAVPGALYGVLMYVGGLVFAFAMRRFTAEAAPHSKGEIAHD